jgi:hypothetical protein
MSLKTLNSTGRSSAMLSSTASTGIHNLHHTGRVRLSDRKTLRGVRLLL